MKKYKSGAPFGFSLPRRLLALFLIFVLVLYAVGMAVAIRLGNNAFAEVRRTYETVSYTHLTLPTNSRV